ncbi:MAG TPA: PAS domain S-box protein [Burkholderiales bacterium]|nr:PAS domain S-box protein [Burkholderiales bacterium]
MTLPGRLRAALEQVSLVRLLIGLGVILVAINIGSAVWDALLDRQRTFRDVQRDVSNITSLLAEQTASGLEAVDLVLRDVQRMGSASRIALQEPRLRDELAYVSQVASILVFDQQGKIVARTNEAPAIEDRRERPFVDTHKKRRDLGLYVSEPYRGGPGNRSWRFGMSRRLNGPGGSFGGVVAALVEIESYERLYRTIDLGPGGFIGVLGADGSVFTRVPDPSHVQGTKLDPNATEALVSKVRSQGRFDGRVMSEVTGEPVIVSIAAVRGLPLYVATGKTERAALTVWRDEARFTAERTLLTSAAMLALIALAAWGLQRREHALQTNEKRFRSMIENSTDAIVVTRPRAEGIVYASPAFRRMTGYGLSDVRGKEFLDFIHPEQRSAALTLRDEGLRVPGNIITREFLVRHLDGSHRWVEVSATNLLHEPAVRAIVINLRDITERKLAEAERLRLENRLRQSAKMEAVGRLAGGIAHDFNNILGGILGYAEMLVETAKEGSAEHRYAQNVLTAAERASALVEQILTYSRSQRGNRVAVDLSAIVAETLELVRGSLSVDSELQITLPAKPLYVIADPTQIHQIVMNLCTNAMHAIGERGTIRVSAEAVDAPAERTFAHTTLAPGRYAVLKVEDTGRGMDATTLGRLFEPFFTTKEVGKGTGLGLSLVYGIVTDSGGAIEVTSTVGKGSCFAVYLPLVDAPAAAADDARGPLVRGRGERVLVVDDEEPLLAVTCESLRRLGYEPAGFADAQAALAEFERQPERYDAVLTDEVMPDFTGTQLATVLLGRRSNLPVILVSGYTGSIITELATSAGVREILKKPVHAQELAAALARALGRT